MTARSLPPSKFRLSLFAVSLRPLLALSSAIFAFFVQLSKIQCGRAAEPVASDFSLSRPVWNVFVFPLTKIFASFLINILEKAKAVWTSDKVETSGFDRFILRARPSFRGANEARKSSSHKCQVGRMWSLIYEQHENISRQRQGQVCLALYTRHSEQVIESKIYCNTRRWCGYGVALERT